MIFNQDKKLELSPEGEAVRLYNELTKPTLQKTVRVEPHNAYSLETKIVDIPNNNYIGDIKSMSIEELKTLTLKSISQKEFIQRFIDIKLNRKTVNQIDYLGESGLHDSQRKLLKNTKFKEVVDIFQ